MTLATLEQPQRRRGTPSDDGQFVAFESVPVFDAHVGDDGVEYDEKLLRIIAENCNRRVRDSGDFVPIVVAHTRDQEDKTHVNDDPPVIGLAGQFYVSSFGNEHPRPCIYATFWIFAEDEKTFLKNPRRSVEIWPEDKPENRYFDPISCLGAETPKRDLGLIYSRRRSGCQPTRHCIPGPLRYSKRSTVKSIKYAESAATTPGGNNTFIPGGTKPKRPVQNAKGAPVMPLAPEDISQIVEAMKPIMQSMIDSSGAGLGDQGDDISAGLDAGPGLDAGLDAPGGDPGLDAPGGPPGIPAPSGGPALDAPGGPPGLDAPGGDAPSMPVDDGIPSPDGMDDDAKLYSRGLGRKFMKYFKEDGGLDDKGADTFMGSLDDDDKKHLGSYMKYMCDDNGRKQKYAERYAKSPIGGTDVTEKPGDSKPSGSMNGAEMKNGEPDRYSRGGAQHYAKVKKERDDAVQKYSKLHADHETLKQKYAKQDAELGQLRTKERYSKRESALLKLSNDFAFDVEEELELVDDFTEAQFDRHCERVIPQRYSKVSGTLIPTDKPGKLLEGAEDKSQRFAGKCRDAVQKYRKSGRSVEYSAVMRHMIENNGEIDESKLFATNGNGKAH